ncbi:MAG: hypothetical protein AAGA38_09675 [Pseudomonadota bacterium]
MISRVWISLVIAFAGSSFALAQSTTPPADPSPSSQGLTAHFVTPQRALDQGTAVINSRLLVVVGRLPQVPPAAVVVTPPIVAPDPEPEVRETVIIRETQRYIPYLSSPKKHSKHKKYHKKTHKKHHKKYKRQPNQWSWATGLRHQRIKRWGSMGRP